MSPHRLVLVVPRQEAKVPGYIMPAGASRLARVHVPVRFCAGWQRGMRPGQGAPRSRDIDRRKRGSGMRIGSGIELAGLSDIGCLRADNEIATPTGRLRTKRSSIAGAGWPSLQMAWAGVKAARWPGQSHRGRNRGTRIPKRPGWGSPIVVARGISGGPPAHPFRAHVR